MPTEITELELVPAEEAAHVDALDRADTPAIWTGYETQLESLAKTANTLTVTDANQRAEIKLARTTRIALKDLRCEIERKRKELGEVYLRKTQRINADANKLKALIEPLELRLKEQEEFAERQEEARKATLQSEREAFLLPLGANPALYKLGEMEAEEFEQLHAGLKSAHEAKVAATAKAAEEAAAKAKAEAEERERMRVENERLQKQAEANRLAMQEIQGIQHQVMIASMGRVGVRKGGTIDCIKATLEETEEWPIGESFGDMKESGQAAKDSAIAAIKVMLDEALEKQRAEAQAKKDREAAAVALAAAQDKAREEAIAAQKVREEEQAKFEAEARKEREAAAAAAEEERKKHAAAQKLAADKSRKEREEIEAKAALERQKAEDAARLERQARERAEAELARQQAETAAAEASKKAAAAAAAKAPDKEKLAAFAIQVRGLDFPAMSTAEGKSLMAEVIAQAEKFASWLEKKSATL